MANLPDLMRTNRSIFSEFFRDLDDFFNMSYGNLPHLSGMANDFVQPSMDLHENDKNYILSFDVPGVRKEDLKIDCTNNILTITGERRQNFGEGKEQRGTRFGRFQRSITLPTGVTADQIQAHYENGVLDVVIPKVEMQERRSIQVGEGRAFNQNQMGDGQQMPSANVQSQPMVENNPRH